MIDWDRVAELRSEIGDEGFAEVVELFLDEVEEVVMRMQARPDPDRLEQNLHFLKGSALNLGFADFGALCQAGQRLAAAGRGGAVDLGAILGCYDASKRAFLGRAAELGLSAA